MANKLKSALVTEINTLYPDNTTEEIAPVDVRTVSIDSVDSWQQAPQVNVQGSTGYTVTVNDYGQVIDLTNAALVNVALPAANSVGFFPFNVMLKSSGAGGVTVAPVTGLFDGVASKHISQGQSIWAISDGTNWRSGLTTSTAGPFVNNDGEVNVKDHGAIGDTVADDTAAITAAIAAVQDGGCLYFPIGYYKVIGSGSSIFTITKAIKIRGDGPGSQFFLPSASVPSTRDLFTFAPTTTVYGITVTDIAINANGFTAGRHMLNFNPSPSAPIYEVNVERCLIFQSGAAGGYSIRMFNCANSTISRNQLDSVWIDGGGDAITIRNNIMGSAINDCVHAAFPPGAAGFVVAENVFSGAKGHVVIEWATSPAVLYNEFEAPISPPNTANTSAGAALVDIGTGPFPSGFTSMNGAQVIGNQFSVLGANNAAVYAVRVRSGVVKANIDDLRYTAVNQIKVDAGAISTKIGRRSGPPLVVTDAGTATSVYPRDILRANRTYFVSNSGSDTDNDGLSASTPFQNIQFAIDTVALLDLGVSVAIIQVAAGTYAPVTLKAPVGFWGSGSLVLQGDTVTPGNVIIQGTGNQTPIVAAGLNAVVWVIRGFKLIGGPGPNSNCIQANTSNLQYANIDFGSCGFNHVLSDVNSNVVQVGPCNISGNAGQHNLTQQGSQTVTLNQVLTFTGLSGASKRTFNTFCNIGLGCSLYRGSNMIFGTSVSIDGPSGNISWPLAHGFVANDPIQFDVDSTNYAISASAGSSILTITAIGVGSNVVIPGMTVTSSLLTGGPYTVAAVSAFPPVVGTTVTLNTGVGVVAGAGGAVIKGVLPSGLATQLLFAVFSPSGALFKVGPPGGPAFPSYPSNGVGVRAFSVSGLRWNIATDPSSVIMGNGTSSPNYFPGTSYPDVAHGGPPDFKGYI